MFSLIAAELLVNQSFTLYSQIIIENLYIKKNIFNWTGTIQIKHHPSYISTGIITK